MFVEPRPPHPASLAANNAPSTTCTYTRVVQAANVLKPVTVFSDKTDLCAERISQQLKAPIKFTYRNDFPIMT